MSYHVLMAFADKWSYVIVLFNATIAQCQLESGGQWKNEKRKYQEQPVEVFYKKQLSSKISQYSIFNIHTCVVVSFL